MPGVGPPCPSSLGVIVNINTMASISMLLAHAWAQYQIVVVLGSVRRAVLWKPNRETGCPGVLVVNTPDEAATLMVWLAPTLPPSGK